MLEKKLTALACVAGILAFGACYGGGGTPSPPTPPPPPPPGIDMKRLHSIRISAINSSESRHLSSDELARAVAVAWRSDHTGVGVYLESAPKKKGEALLEISVLSEHASPVPPTSATGERNLAIVIWLSATFTSQNGNVIWHQSDTQYSISCATTSIEASDAWNAPSFRACAMNPIASQLVNQLVYTLEKSSD